MAAPRSGVHQQQQQQQQPYSATHPSAQFRHEVDDREMADAGRDRDRERAPRVTGGGSGGGYTGYEGRSTRSEAAMDQDTFGFMAPCWRLLERAKAYMDEASQVVRASLEAACTILLVVATLGPLAACRVCLGDVSFCPSKRRVLGFLRPRH